MILQDSSSMFSAKKSLLIFLCVFSAWTSHAFVYIPINDTSNYAIARTQLKNSFNDQILKLPTANKDKVQKVYELRHQELVDGINSHRYFTNSSINDYLNVILREIKRGNPGLISDDLRLWVSRETEPNASCFGEGTILINIGLLNHMENESQIAFVLCHELSHYLLNHVNRNIQNSISSFYSEKIQKELEKINASQYNRYNKTMNLYNGLMKSIRKHSRKDEEEADSLGFILLSNTVYDTKSALTALEILDHVDSLSFPEALTLNKTFDFPNYHFQDEWLDSDVDGMSIRQTQGKEEKLLLDSLKTHPDCQVRISLLEVILKGETRKFFLQAESDFIRVTDMATFECVQSNFDFNDLGQCLYLTISLQKKYPNSSYLVTMSGKCFSALFEAQKNHSLHTKILPPSKRVNPNYNQLLVMVHNLRLSEIPMLGYWYLQRYSYSDEEYLYTVYLNAKNTNIATIISTAALSYKKAFPEGKYISKIE